MRSVGVLTWNSPVYGVYSPLPMKTLTASYHWKTLLVFAIHLAMISGFVPAASYAQEKPVVLVSVVPQEYFVNRIAGGAVSTEVMVTSGDDHGGYEPTVKQMKSASTAVIYITVGHPHFVFEERWLSRIKELNRSLLIVNGFEGIKLNSDDPHPWVSPKAALQLISNIEQALITKLPRQSDSFRASAAALMAEVKALDAEIESRLKHQTQRTFLVFHPTWGYFASDYGLTQLSIEHEGKEANILSLQQVIAQAKSLRINRVIVQPQFSKQSAETVANELGAKIIEVNPLEPDWFVSTRAFLEAVAAP